MLWYSYVWCLWMRYLAISFVCVLIIPHCIICWMFHCKTDCYITSLLCTVYVQIIYIYIYISSFWGRRCAQWSNETKSIYRVSEHFTVSSLLGLWNHILSVQKLKITNQRNNKKHTDGRTRLSVETAHHFDIFPWRPWILSTSFRGDGTSFQHNLSVETVHPFNIHLSVETVHPFNIIFPWRRCILWTFISPWRRYILST
jgi:hypothetical protein